MAITPLTIGSKTFKNNLIQAPLAGVSNAAFRLLVARYGEPAYTCTEMISAKTIIQNNAMTKRYLFRFKDEGEVCYQLSANDPTELAQATRIVTEQGADLIDLNCGCPVNKIRKKGAGSKLLSRPTLLAQLLDALKSNTNLPVTVKVRVDGTSQECHNDEVIKVINDSGVDAVIVHGRHWSEHYETPCNLAQIQYFVSKLSVPVIGNGDIGDIQSLERMFTTGCAGAMIGRRGVGDPWLIKRLIEGKPNKHSSLFLKTIGATIIEHGELLSEIFEDEKFALLQLRKILKYYARDLPTKKQFLQEAFETTSMDVLKIICKTYFQ